MTKELIRELRNAAATTGLDGIVDLLVRAAAALAYHAALNEVLNDTNEQLREDRQESWDYADRIADAGETMPSADIAALRKDINAADFGVPAEWAERAENYARWVVASERDAWKDDSALANMFWDFADSEHCYDSIKDLLNDEWRNISIDVGDLFTIQRAAKMENINIRVTSIDDESRATEFEVINAAMTKETK